MKLNKILISAIAFMPLFCATAFAQKESAKLPDISKEIVKMRDLDQKMRIKWSGQVRKGKNKSEKFKEFTSKLITLDRQHTARMREIIEAHGWPTYALVGKGASNSAWLIVQHADRNPLFQVNCLPLLKEAVDNGQANPSNYAYLYDRVQVARGEKQLYATQSSSNNGLKDGNFYPIAKEHEVQKRREEMGITQNVEDYAKSMGFEYVIPSAPDALTRITEVTLSLKNHRVNIQIAIDKQDYPAAAEEYLKLTEFYGSIDTKDFVEAARMLSLAKHEDMGKGLSFLTKAMVRGWDEVEKVKTSADFENLRNNSPAQWKDFLVTAMEMKLDR